MPSVLHKRDSCSLYLSHQRHINVVAPGPTWPSLNVADQRMPEERIAHLGETEELKRVAQPEELAPVYVFLASDADSSFITGEVVAATGSMTVTR